MKKVIIIGATRIGHAMIKILYHGQELKQLENKDINALVQNN
ncbi:hypothetical protein [Flagellimonas myxillae]|nr:hypothetical protein [Muricauda myxillae]